MTTRNGKHTGGPPILDVIPQTLVHGAEEGAAKVAEAVEHASARISRSAGLAARSSGQSIKEAQLGMRQARVSARERIMSSVGRSMMKRPAALPGGDALLKAQLAKTSRELAHESSDLGAAVESLNKVIRANRRAAAKGRTRLLGGFALGALLTYHFDAEHGRERRAATAQMINGLVSGRREPPSPAI